MSFLVKANVIFCIVMQGLHISNESTVQKTFRGREKEIEKERSDRERKSERERGRKHAKH